MSKFVKSIATGIVAGMPVGGIGGIVYDQIDTPAPIVSHEPNANLVTTGPTTATDALKANPVEKTIDSSTDAVSKLMSSPHRQHGEIVGGTAGLTFGGFVALRRRREQKNQDPKSPAL